MTEAASSSSSAPAPAPAAAPVQLSPSPFAPPAPSPTESNVSAGTYADYLARKLEETVAADAVDALDVCRVQLNDDVKSVI